MQWRKHLFGKFFFLFGMEMQLPCEDWTSIFQVSRKRNHCPIRLIKRDTLPNISIWLPISLAFPASKGDHFLTQESSSLALIQKRQEPLLRKNRSSSGFENALQQSLSVCAIRDQWINNDRFSSRVQGQLCNQWEIYVRRSTIIDKLLNNAIMSWEWWLKRNEREKSKRTQESEGERKKIDSKTY